MKAYEEVVPSPAFVDVYCTDDDLDELLADIDEIVINAQKTGWGSDNFGGYCS